MENKKAIQGTADGLCGLYALINFLLVKDLIGQDDAMNRSAPQEAMRLLTEAAQRLHLLTPDKIVSGLEWHDMLQIFNIDAERRFLDFRAVPLRILKNVFPSIGNRDAVSRIIAEGGAAVISVERGGHWVLAYALNDVGSIAVLDPSYGPRAKMSVSKVSSLEDGLAILPVNSDLLKAIDAKTH